MDSPLTQQLRPDSFEPKIVQLYLHLFNILPNDDSIEELTPSEGFWREFFLLKPDKRRLYEILEPFTASELVHCHVQTQAFFRRSITEVGCGSSPQNENALENLAGFLSAVFAKRYMNPSTDIIEVLGGLDAIDRLVSGLVNNLDTIIRTSPSLALRSKAVSTATVMVAGAFQTSLISYFTHRDLFPALMKYVHDDPSNAHESYILLGCLASYQKFEAQNVYQNRIEDFVDQSAIRLLLDSFAQNCQTIRDSYTVIQDDAAPAITLSSALSYVGLRSLSPDARKPPPPNEDEAKALFAALPPPLACTLLSTYTFIHANKIFASSLLTPSPSAPLTATTTTSTSTSPAPTTPLAALLSLISYLTHHAHRTARGTAYATLSLLALRLLLEDPLTAKPLVHASSHTLTTRLARQRPPYLPLTTSPRPPAATILDIAIDTLSHNLRRQLSVPLYSAALATILRVLGTLSATSTRMSYHWPYLWGALFSLIKFLTSYADDLRGVRGVKEEVAAPVAECVASALVKGDGFLPGEGDYDDLFYKALEGWELLPRFRTAWGVKKGEGKGGAFERAVDALVKVSAHFHQKVGEKGLAGRGRRHQSASEVKGVVREGYETLDLVGVAGAGGAEGGGRGAAADAGFGRWEVWREGERKAEVKKLIRVAVEDARLWGMGSSRMGGGSKEQGERRGRA